MQWKLMRLAFFKERSSFDLFFKVLRTSRFVWTNSDWATRFNKKGANIELDTSFWLMMKRDLSELSAGPISGGSSVVMSTRACPEKVSFSWFNFISQSSFNVSISINRTWVDLIKSGDIWSSKVESWSSWYGGRDWRLWCDLRLSLIIFEKTAFFEMVRNLRVSIQSLPWEGFIMM